MPVTQTKHNYQPDLNFDLGEYCFLIVGRVRSFAELCLMRFPGFATLGRKSVRAGLARCSRETPLRLLKLGPLAAFLVKGAAGSFNLKEPEDKDRIAYVGAKMIDSVDSLYKAVAQLR